jgi:beta-glucosidase
MGDAEPGGRLAESVPVHVAQLPAHRNFPGAPRQVQYREGAYVGYRFHDTAGVPARFAFGHGLSYTSFEWTDIALEGEDTDVTVSVTVTNVGDRAGSDVIQVYVRDVASTVHRPDKELKAFAKVHLEPGAHQRLTLALDRRSFAVWDVAAHDWLVEAGDFEVVVARSSADPVAVLDHHVASSDQITAVPAPAGMVATDAEFEALLGHPVAAVAPMRPFHRNSTLEELETTVLGRVIGAAVIRVGLQRAAAEFPDPDAATVAMVRSAIREGPLRALVLLSGGMVTFPMVDALLSTLNASGGRLRRMATGIAARSGGRRGTG